jgi:hypothetical protein
MSVRTSFVGALFAVLLGGMLFIAFSPDQKPARAESEEGTPTPYPNGVYFFPVTGDAYRHALGTFVAKHPELTCQYAGYDEMLPVSDDRGHTWLCRDVAIEAQDVTVP